VLRRYLRLYAAFVRNCLMRALEYRGQFLVAMLVYNVWTASSLLLITFVFQQVGAVRGWSQWDMYVLYGTYVLLENALYGLLGPNMWRFNSYVRNGTLDWVLTKPVNTQFFSSTRYIDTNAVFNLPVGCAVLGYGLAHQPHWPGLFDVMAWAIVVVCGFLIAYSIWFMIVTLTIWIVKLDAAGAAFEPFFQIAKFPLDVYPKRFQMLLTFVLPVAFFTTVPVGFLLGRGDAFSLGYALLTAAAFLTLSNRFWNFALRHYGSASS